MKYASLGSISHGTLRPEDLLATFADELEHHIQRNAEAWCSDEGRAQRDAYLILVDEARNTIDAQGETDAPDADDMLIELQDALQTFAKPYCYFGTHEGDGSDFGFWPCMEEIDELPRVEDSDQARELGEDCAFVNDHGNVTVFGGDGSVVLEIV